MINYNPKAWLRFIFEFHKSDTVRMLLPSIFWLVVYSFVVAYLILEVFYLPESNHLKNIPVMHSLLGFAISMLLVFRTNTAYDRWWEGRKLWGSLVNTSRNLAIKLDAMLPDESDRSYFKELIPYFAEVLKCHMQTDLSRHQPKISDHPDLHVLDNNKHMPAQIAGLMIKRINQLYKAGIITGDQLIILNNEITSFLDICGACERIKNTPIPYSYSVFIKKFMFIYVMTLPFGYVFSLGYLMIPVVVFIFYVLASLEIIAEEIEDPFGTDDNDLPMERLTVVIRRSVRDIL